MFRVKIKKIGFAAYIQFFLIIVTFGQSLEDQIEKNIALANSFQNVNSDSIMHYAKQAFLLAENMQIPEKQVDALSLLINTQIKIGKYSNAILSCQMADSISLANNLQRKRSQVMIYKGLVFQNAGFLSEGLDFLFDAQKQIDELGQQELAANLYYYIALAYFDLGEIKHCKENVNKAIAIERSTKNVDGLVKNYILLANISTNIDSIHYYLDLAEDIVSKGKMLNKKVALLNNKALLYKAIGENTKAKSIYQEAIQISVSNRYISHLGDLYNNYAYLLMEEKKLDSVKIVLNQALLLAQEVENIDLEASISDTYSDYYSSFGDSAMSYQFYKKSIKLKEQYRENQRIEQSLFLSTVFETEKKEIEIARQDSKLYRINTFLLAALVLLSIAIAVVIYLRQKSAMRKERIKSMEQEKKLEVANALIEGQDAERKRLAMDLHDGISPKIGALRYTIEANFKHEKEYEGVIGSINDIHHNIRDISHKMLPSQLESQGLVVAIKNLLNLLEKNSNSSFTFYTNLQNRLKPKQEVNLFYLSYEMINNSVKHSNAESVNVQLLVDNESISLSVEDDGVGFDQNSNFEGLGLRNIRQRVNYLNGILNIDSAPGQGTAILLELIA